MENILYKLKNVYTKSELAKLEDLHSDLVLANAEKAVLRKTISDICFDLDNGERVDLDWVNETINDNIIQEVSTMFHKAVLNTKNKEIDKLKQENEKLRECVKSLIEATLFGVNQWQEAWSPYEETNAQKVIKQAQQTLEEINK